jgi:aspartokinase
VRSAFNPEEGTWVDGAAPDGRGGPVAVVSDLTLLSGAAAVSVIGRRIGAGARAAHSAAMLDALEDEDISARIVNGSSCRLTCSVPAADARRATIRLHQLYVEQGYGTCHGGRGR